MICVQILSFLAWTAACIFAGFIGTILVIAVNRRRK